MWELIITTHTTPLSSDKTHPVERRIVYTSYKPSFKSILWVIDQVFPAHFHGPGTRHTDQKKQGFVTCK